MIRFSDVPYSRPDLTAFHNSFNDLFRRLKKTTAWQETFYVLLQLDYLISLWRTASCIWEIRHTGNVNDPVYKEEVDLFSVNQTVFIGWLDQLNRILLENPHRETLESYLAVGSYKNSMQMKSYDEALLSLFEEETRLSDLYSIRIWLGCIRYLLSLAIMIRRVGQFAPWRMKRVTSSIVMRIAGKYFCLPWAFRKILQRSTLLAWNIRSSSIWIKYYRNQKFHFMNMLDAVLAAWNLTRTRTLLSLMQMRLHKYMFNVWSTSL